MQNRIYRQRGMSFFSWMFVLMIALFFVMLGIKMVPTYMQSFTVDSVLSDLDADAKARQMGPKELKATIMKRFKINGVRGFNVDDLHISEEGGRTLVKAEYEVRKPVMNNVSVVMSFSKQAEIR